MQIVNDGENFYRYFGSYICLCLELRIYEGKGSVGNIPF